MHMLVDFLWMCMVEAGAAAFARRKRRKAAGGKIKKIFPPVPPSLLCGSVERLLCLAALGAEDSFEFPLNAEGLLCKIAALFLCLLSGSRMGMVGTGKA